MERKAKVAQRGPRRGSIVAITAAAFVGIILLMTSGYANGEATNSQVRNGSSEDGVDGSLSSKLSSMIGGMFGNAKSLDKKTEESNLVKDNKLKGVKEGDLIDDVVDKGLPNKTSLEETNVGVGQLSLLMEQKAQALELQRQGKDCTDCIDDGEGNMLPSSLVQAIRMQKKKIAVDQAEGAKGVDSQTVGEDLASQSRGTASNDDNSVEVDEDEDEDDDDEDFLDDTERELAARRFDCRCELPGEGIYAPLPNYRNLAKRKRPVPSSELVNGNAAERDLMSGYRRKDLIAVDGQFILPSDHPACVNVDFICPGDIPNR